jgi:hypothetical protein
VDAVTHLNQLGETVAAFTGKTLDEAMKAAGEWASRHHAELGRYYVQFSGRSIIADYTKKAEEV